MRFMDVADLKKKNDGSNLKLNNNDSGADGEDNYDDDEFN